MGVINITPNSFSDGGKITDASTLLGQVLAFKSEGVSIIDLGAESTAPFNDAITCEEEKKRFQSYFFPLLESKKWPSDIILSVDTYRFETFSYVYHQVKEKSPQTKLIWNDVSGAVEAELLTFLKSEVPEAFYIHCHTLTPERSMASSHMDWAQELPPNVFFTSMKEKLQQSWQTFSDQGLGERILFDPCFGFSKTREQNCFLLEHLHELVETFPSTLPWVLGISRKSFLRERKGPMLPEEIPEVEKKQREIIRHWSQLLGSYQLLFRVHRSFELDGEH